MEGILLYPIVVMSWHTIFITEISLKSIFLGIRSLKVPGQIDIVMVICMNKMERFL